MIKRIIACFTICLIITGLISPVFSNASAVPQPNWTDPGISEIINVSDLTGWMLNGGVYDVSTYTDSESFMTDYFNARTSHWSNGPELYYYNKFGIGQDLYNIGSESYHNLLDTNRLMASSFREHSGYGRRFSDQANKALLNSGKLYNMKIPLLNEVEFANFVGYNHNALNLYSDFFTLNQPEQPTPNPDTNYQFISNVNNYFLNDSNICKTFSLHNWVSAYNYNYEYTFNIDFSQYSWLAQNNYSFTSSHVSNVDPSQAPSFCLIDDILNIYLNNDGSNGYNVSYSPSNFNILNAADFLEGNFGPSYYQQIYYNNNDLVYCYVEGSNVTEPELINHYDSLNLAINDIYSKFCNINLYVEGNPWVLVSGEKTNIVIPEFPDAVGGEDLPTTTWPISKPRAPYYISVPGMLKAIDDAIQGDGKLDIDDLKPYLTDENGNPVPDPQFDPEPIPIPVPDPVNPDVVPQLPVLPAMPLDMPGFSGVSVLAEIINFTNQSLPNSLIVTFWGIVFGLVILGLIKILHK